MNHEYTCIWFPCTCKKSGMKITLIIIALFQLSFLGCATKDSKQDLEPTAKDASSTQPTTTPILVDGVGGVINFEPVPGYATSEESKLIGLAGKKLNETIHSQCFYDFIAQRKMIQTQNRTSKEVADHITHLNGTVPVVMYFRKFTSAMAYRQPPELKINLNRKYFYASLPLCDWANTLGHESLGHSLGNYDHDFNYSPSRDYSVPYSIGFAVDACCLK